MEIDDLTDFPTSLLAFLAQVAYLCGMAKSFRRSFLLVYSVFFITLGSGLVCAQQPPQANQATCAGEFLGQPRFSRRYPKEFRELLLQLKELPADVHGEIVDDKIRVLPSGTPEHSHAVAELKALLKPFMDDPDGWIILAEQDLIVKDHKTQKFRTVRPDNMGWRKARITRDDLKKTPVEVIPDWIAEVASPNTKDDDRYEKMPLYAKNGVKYLWLVLPEIKKVEVWRLGRRRSTLLGFYDDRQIISAEPFLAREINLTTLWLDYYF